MIDEGKYCVWEGGGEREGPLVGLVGRGKSKRISILEMVAI